jgi:hypothetical protein
VENKQDALFKKRIHNFLLKGEIMKAELEGKTDEYCAGFLAGCRFIEEFYSDLARLVGLKERLNKEANRENNDHA